LKGAHARSATIRGLVLVEADLDRNLVANPIERWVFRSGRVRSRLEDLLASSTCGSSLGRVANCWSLRDEEVLQPTMLAGIEMACIMKEIAIRYRLMKGADGENGLKHLACRNLSTQFVRDPALIMVCSVLGFVFF
jgi:hypothetical protein